MDQKSYINLGYIGARNYVQTVYIILYTDWEFLHGRVRSFLSPVSLPSNCPAVKLIESCIRLLRPILQLVERFIKASFKNRSFLPPFPTAKLINTSTSANYNAVRNDHRNCDHSPKLMRAITLNQLVTPQRLYSYTVLVRLMHDQCLVWKCRFDGLTVNLMHARAAAFH